MAKKIMIITGSPRKSGNTNKIANWVAEAARDNGAEVEVVDAAHLNYKTYGCTACMGCQQSDEYRCIIKDEASDIIARIPEQDVLVLASPVYFMGFSAQLKLVIDRMFSLVKIDAETQTFKHNLQDLEYALIATGGGDEGSGLNLVESTMKAIAGFYGKPIKSLLVPFAPSYPGDLDTNIDIQDKAVNFGTDISG